MDGRVVCVVVLRCVECVAVVRSDGRVVVLRCVVLWWVCCGAEVC